MGRAVVATDALQGYVSQLQDFCMHDGEGIRTTIFLSGCPLRCQWCANPETWQLNGGQPTSVVQIIEKCVRQRVFYSHSGGGVTISGGEPGLQPLFVQALTAALKSNGFDVCMETSGHFDWEEMAPAVRELDMLFFDLKHLDDSTHRRLTGVSNRQILANLVEAAASVPELIVRIPLIPQVNDQEENLKATAAFVSNHLPNPRIEILPYHNWSKKKYQNLGLPFREFAIPAPQDIARAKKILTEGGATIVDFK